ncbi:MAG: TauD/TfdA family dioxygenase [Rhodospirillaceae bacterium]
METRHLELSTKCLTGAIGSEILGIDLCAPEQDNYFPDIYQEFLDRAVVVLRDQDLSPEELIKFSRRFGKLESHVLSQFNMKEHPEILYISNVREDGKPIGAIHAGQYWHSDLSYMPHPTQASLLHAKEIPSYGGDTLFVNMRAAFDALSDRMKNFLDGMTAVHDYTLAYEKYFAHLPNRPPLSAEEKAKVPPVVHPVIRIHPETGRKTLYVNPGFTRRITELTPSESGATLDFLFDHCQRPEFIYRHSWRPGDLVIWDNRQTCHNAVADYDMNERRHLIRCSVEGDVPH